MDRLITDEMLDAAMKKAVEAGLLPRYACRDNGHGYAELIRYVIQAALDAREDAPWMQGLQELGVVQRRKRHRLPVIKRRLNEILVE